MGDRSSNKFSQFHEENITFFVKMKHLLSLPDMVESALNLVKLKDSLLLTGIVGFSGFAFGDDNRVMESGFRIEFEF